MSSIRHSPRSLASRWKGTICTPLQNHHRPLVQSDRGNCMTICLVPIADTLIFGGYSWYPIVSMIIGATLIAIARVRHATLLHLWFQFLLCCSSWLKTLLTQLSSHTSGLLSTQTEFSHYSHCREHVSICKLKTIQGMWDHFQYCNLLCYTWYSNELRLILSHLLH